jgi:MFS family permease
MKKVIAFLLIIALGYLATSYGPWYLIVIAGFLGGLLIRNQWQGLLIGFLAGFTLWLGQVWWLQNQSASDLPQRMADLFGLPNEWLLWLITAVIGGLVTGFSSAAGGAISAQKKKKRKRKYVR